MNNDQERIEKLSNEICRLSSLLVESITTTRETFKRLEEKINDHSKELWGYGDGSAGISKNVDRLITKQEERTWLMRATLGTVIALVAERIWRIFHI